MGRDPPIILVHGKSRFDVLLRHSIGQGSETASNHYFRGIGAALCHAGFEAFCSYVGGSVSVEVRAEKLRREILRITRDFELYPRVHIIAYSMGGIDARLMIYKHDMADRVANLTTLGSPHLGASLADVAMAEYPALIRLARRIGLDYTGIADLTTRRRSEFNEEAASFERRRGVKYGTIAGAQDPSRMGPMLRRLSEIIAAREGPNDGMVSLVSARWRDDVHVRDLDANHLNMIGWREREEAESGSTSTDFNRWIQDVYVNIARTL
jgi:triacylglycerol lipase